MDESKESLMFSLRMRQIRQYLDIFYLAFSGRDVDPADALYGPRREPLSVQGTIKKEISLIPFQDVRLKKVVKKYGGWEKIMEKSFAPPDSLYVELEMIGFSRAEIDKSRAYKNDPAQYIRSAEDKSKDVQNIT